MTNGERNTPLWTILMVVAGLVAFAGWQGDRRLRELLADEVHTQIQTSLNANATALNIWITNQIRLADSIALDPELRTMAIQQFNRAERLQFGKELPLDPQLEELNKMLSQRLEPLGFEGVLVSSNLAVVAGSGRIRGRVGQVLGGALHRTRFTGLFQTGEPVIVTPFRPALVTARGRTRQPGEFPGGTKGPPGEPPGGLKAPPSQPQGGFKKFPGKPGKAGKTNIFERKPLPLLSGLLESGTMNPGDIMLMQVAVPIRDGSGAVRGALSLIINTETEFSRILSVSRRGDSGETYAFDRNGLMISRSRFDKLLPRLGLIEDRPGATAALNLRLTDPGGDLADGYEPELPPAERPLIRLVAEGVKEKSGFELLPTRDYRGVPVVGAWRWMPHQEFGLATQIDAKEAYAPLRVLRFVFVVLFGLLVMTASSLFVFSFINLKWRRRVTEAELKARQLGQYKLEEKIGEGGMGVVYRASHALLRRDTAIKLLLPSRANRETIERFEREVQQTCRLTHPNTIQVYDYGRTPEGIFYYAMELLRGLTLKELVQRYGPQPEPRAIHILVQVCDALHEAHEIGLVHRDLKPANVFLSHRGGVPDSVKVLDFGLVREFRASPGPRLDVTADNAMVGTPLFMAPESIRDPKASDPRSDIYSLGALAYFMVTGTHVFTADTQPELFAKHLTEAPAAPSTRTSNLIGPEFEQIIFRCLEKEPAKRPASVRELRSLLLACPRAGEWTSEAQESWWKAHGAEILNSLPAKPEADDAFARTVKVAVTPRIQPGA